MALTVTINGRAKRRWMAPKALRAVLTEGLAWIWRESHGTQSGSDYRALLLRRLMVGKRTVWRCCISSAETRPSVPPADEQFNPPRRTFKSRLIIGAEEHQRPHTQNAAALEASGAR